MQTFHLSILDKINSRILQDKAFLQSISFATSGWKYNTDQQASQPLGSMAIQLAREIFEIVQASGEST